MEQQNHVILVTGSYDHTLKFWDAIRGDVTDTINYGKDDIVNKIQISKSNSKDLPTVLESLEKNSMFSEYFPSIVVLFPLDTTTRFKLSKEGGANTCNIKSCKDSKSDPRP